MISIRGAMKRYSSEVQIGPVDLDLPAGGVTALIGPNGAGKSTLLTMAGRLTEMDGGSIEVAGHDIRRTSSNELAKVMAILRQENHYVTRLTVRQLVGLGRFPYSKGRLTEHDQALIDQAVDFLDLGQLQGRYLDELSGGQRQRAYVAMVLAQDTDYLLLDEPLNNLDMRHGVQIMRLLRDAADELGRTVVVVLHDINFAGRYADRICAMKDSRVVCFGTPEEIIRDEVLTDIFDTPVQCIPGPVAPIAVYY
ncbi:iron ABC transporter ATP-binding protein [Enemella sp. A6]|uniref:iron ABC transporter ATP-binding protein n=1 Tax=Enemella sp. A6 TaxID=3440152 RepID=UPI003EBBD432